MSLVSSIAIIFFIGKIVISKVVISKVIISKAVISKDIISNVIKGVVIMSLHLSYTFSNKNVCIKVD
jgi:hypothetical protein